MISCYSSAPDGVLVYRKFCLGPASQPHTETGQHSFLLQADSTRLTPAVLLNSAPVWAEDMQWKLNLRHLGPEREPTIAQIAYVYRSWIIHWELEREGVRKSWSKKRSYFWQHSSRNKVTELCQKCDISLKCQEGQKFRSYLPSNSPSVKGRSPEWSLQLTR